MLSFFLFLLSYPFCTLILLLFFSCLSYFSSRSFLRDVFLTLPFSIIFLFFFCGFPFWLSGSVNISQLFFPWSCIFIFARQVPTSWKSGPSNLFWLIRRPVLRSERRAQLCQPQTGKSNSEARVQPNTRRKGATGQHETTQGSPDGIFPLHRWEPGSPGQSTGTVGLRSSVLAQKSRCRHAAG